MKPFNRLPATRSFGILILGFLSIGTVSYAQQEVVAPLPSPINGILEQAGIPIPPPSQDPSTIESVVRPESPFQYQPFVLMPHVLYRFLYEYGVLVAPGRSATTVIESLDPGFTLQIGSNWTVDYTADWDAYTSHSFKNTLGHSATVVGKQSFDNWTVLLTQGYNYSSQPLVETAIQTTEQDYKTSLGLSRELGQYFLTETIVDQDLRYALTFPDTYQWSIEEWLHYRFDTQFDAAIGGKSGYVHESQGSDSDYTQPEAKVSWQPTDKLDVSANAGVEDRVFLDYPRTSLNTPTYNLSLQYEPFQATKLIVDLAQLVTPSYLTNQSSKITRENLSLSQRILGKIYLVGGVGHNHVSYLATMQSEVTARDDSQTTFNVSLSTAFLSRGTFTLLYFRSQNISSIASFGFTTNQFGMELGYRY